MKLDTKDLCVAPCMFSNGKSLIPDSDFCAPENLTEDVKQIVQCVSAQGEAVCAPPCKWRRGTQAASELPTGDATNDQVDFTTDDKFFTKNFCHPDSTGEGWTQNAEICLKQSDKATCENEQTSKCVWSTGKLLIPAEDFCAPAKMTKDDTIIMGCVSTQSESNCLNTCKWYKGTGENSNTDQNIVEYCHTKDRSSSTYDITTDACMLKKA